MTAPMPLPELLIQLATVLPERVAIQPTVKVPRFLQTFEVLVAGEVRDIWELGRLELYDMVDGLAPLLLEMALREEVEARGWMWHIDSDWNGAGSQAVIRTADDQTLAGCLGPTPALALAGALLQVLKVKA